jgi:hypothetical protein
MKECGRQKQRQKFMGRSEGLGTKKRKISPHKQWGKEETMRNFHNEVDQEMQLPFKVPFLHIYVGNHHY